MPEKQQNLPPLPPGGYDVKAMRAVFADDRVAEGMGVVIDSVADGGAVCSMQAGPQHLNATGAVQGGAVYTLADVAFSVAANSLYPVTVTLNSDLHFLRPLTEGRLLARATPVSHTKRTCVYQVEVFGADGARAALGTFTGYTRKPGKQADKNGNSGREGRLEE